MSAATTTILETINQHGLVNGMAILLIIFMALTAVFLSKHVLKKDDEIKALHEYYSCEIDKTNKRYTKENREDRIKFIEVLKELTEKIVLIEKDTCEIKQILMNQDPS